MSIESDVIQELVDKESIRQLAMLYCRGVDRKDADLLRDLYTDDATDTHGDSFDGSAGDYVEFLKGAFPFIKYSGHHICNHLISITGNQGEGEVYAIAYHIIPDSNGHWIEDIMCVRYLDHYRKESDGHWRFSKRVVTYDMRSRKAISEADLFDLPESDPSFEVLTHRLFASGKRA